MRLDEEIHAKLRAELGEEEVDRLMFQSAVPGILSALSLARVRCMTFSELITCLDQIEQIEDAPHIIDRFCELELTPDQQSLLVPALKSLAERAESLPAKEKSRIERYLRRLLLQLAPESAAEVAGPFFAHKRRVRRQIAFDVFRRTGVTPSLAEDLWTLYQERGDQEYLELIARTPTALMRLPVDKVLHEVEDEYWRARIIQATIERNANRAPNMAQAYPYEFVHAVGRTRDASFMPVLLGIFQGNRMDLEFLSIFTWCLGVLGARDHLHVVEDAIAEKLGSLTKDSRGTSGFARGAKPEASEP